jgi:dihydropteroate synthase
MGGFLSPLRAEGWSGFMGQEHIHFVTGRLAEPALRDMLAHLAPQVGFAYSVDVMPITVAALMTPEWIARRIHPPVQTTKVMLPGYCGPGAGTIEAAAKVPVVLGPRDLRQLPEYFGCEGGRPESYGDYDIEIIAEINHAPRLPLDEVRRQARLLANDGADVIDVGCDPGGPWTEVADCVRALREDGHRVSIDSLDPREIEPAVRAGAELVLSVNSTNRRYAAAWGCEVVAIPDDPARLETLEETVAALEAAKVPYRIDPILAPIGFGFAASLERYQDVRRRWPAAAMMMGIGNVTELTDADSAAVNVLLLAICQELSIRSVLTTQVINWARSSVRECDFARRLVFHAIENRVPPKHLEPQLVMLRDPKLLEHGRQRLAELAEQIKDNNFRIFAEGGAVHLVSSGLHLQNRDPFLLFDELAAGEPGNLDPAHAFYLGYEMAKAATALTLGKNYRQDEALDWGFLTLPEESHRERKSAARRTREGGSE